MQLGSGGGPDNAHLLFQFDAGLLFYGFTDRSNHRFYVGSGSTPGVHNEICVARRNHGATDTKLLKSARLDESRRFVILRIAEHGPRIRQVQRLSTDTAGKQL